jgi:phosphate-selective porin OprO/OprP
MSDRRVPGPLRSILAVALLAAAAPAAAEITITPGVSIMVDTTSIDSDTFDYGDTTTRFRRLRPALSFGVDGQWAVKLEHDLADRSAPEASLQVNLGPGDMLRIGQFKQPFLMEDAISDKQTPFLEQSLAGTLSLGRRLGVGLERVRPDWTLAGSLIGQRLDGTQERVGITSRATRVLWRDGDALLHVGGSLAWENNEFGSFRVNSRPEAYFASRALVDTGTLPDVDTVGRGGLEAVWINGPFSVQGELVAVHATRELGTGTGFDGSGGSLVLGWSPTGHRRGYSKGVLGAPATEGRQAVELFARISTLDLNDGAVRGGRETNASLGVVWYPIDHVRVMANWIHVDSDRRGVSDNPSIASLRLQLVF